MVSHRVLLWDHYCSYYINDITYGSDVYTIDFILLADNTILLYSQKDITNRMNFINQEHADVSNWFKANKLSINAIKTNHMILGTCHMTTDEYHVKYNIILNDTVLERVKVT